MIQFTKITRSVSVSGISYLVFIILAIWLFFTAIWIDIEYYDGLDTICNARFFIGKIDHYVGNRMPLMAFLLIPAEFIKIAFQLHPLEVRPHHLTMAILHISYLFLVYRWLNKKFGRSWTVFVAFISTIPSFIFFSYSPFINHDIFPGMILMAMLLLADRYFDSPRFRTWIFLIVCGTTAALIKQTFAIFWVVVLLSNALIIVFHRTEYLKSSMYSLFKLGFAAIISGIITWLVLGFILESVFSDKIMLLRPYYHIEYILHQYDGSPESLFPWWVYYRNAWSYGSVFVLLIIPGLVMAFRGTRLHQSFALSWIISIVLLHIFSVREVRYIAFLAPLSAFLLVQPIRYIIKYPFAVIVLLSLLLFDFTRISTEAARVVHPFYSDSMAKKLLQPMMQAREEIIINWPMLSFESPIDSPLIGDRYHRLFHFGIHHFIYLYDIDPKDLIQVKPSFSIPDQYFHRNDGTILIHTNKIVVNRTDWVPQKPHNNESLEYFFAINKSIPLKYRSGDDYETTEGQILSLRTIRNQGKSVWVVKGDFLVRSLKGCVLPCIYNPKQNIGFDLKILNQDHVAILGYPLKSFFQNSGELIIHAFDIKRVFKNGKLYRIGDE